MHASIGDHMFLVPSPNLHDCSLNPSSISYLVNPSWRMQIRVHEILVWNASIGDHVNLVGFLFVYGNVIKCILNKKHQEM